MSVASLEKQLLALRPLDEDDVESFEDLIAELCEVGSLDAAVVLLRQLDDSCPLEGVMQTAATSVGQLDPNVLVPAFVQELPGLGARASQASRDVIRCILRNDTARAALAGSAAALGGDAKDPLRELLNKVGRFSRWEAWSKEVLAVL